MEIHAYEPRKRLNIALSCLLLPQRPDANILARILFWDEQVEDCDEDSNEKLVETARKTAMKMVMKTVMRIP